MSTRTMPVVIVPATDTAAALLTDWLIRDVLPTALDGGVANHAGARLRTLPPVSRRHIRHPRKLRVHTRRVSEVIAAIENHLQTGADFVDAERTFMRSTTVLPDPVLNAAGQYQWRSDGYREFRGGIGESCPPSRSDDNRVVGSGALDAIEGKPNSYYALLARLWHRDFHASIVIPQTEP